MLGKKFLPLTFSLLLIALATQHALAVERPLFQIEKDGAITAQATNAQLKDLLKSFSATFNIEVRGIPAHSEPISINLSHATLDETLKRLLRGFNYVLIQEDVSKKPAIVIFGKAERAKYVDEPTPARQAAAPPAPAAAPTPAGHGAAASPHAASPVQGAAPPRRAGVTDQPMKQDEVTTEGMVASVRPSRSSRSDGPPVPPQIPGLELPPMPPSLDEARGTGQIAAINAPPQIPGENSSGQAAVETPPEIPNSTAATQQKPKPKLDLRDLAPPSIPF